MDPADAAGLPSSVFTCTMPKVALGLSCESVKDETKCESNSDCAWCTSGAVGASCMDAADAKGLPSSVFSCTFGSGAKGATTAMPVDWPTQYTIQFKSNITTEVTMPVMATDNTMYYDATVKLQRVDHGAGSYECYRFYNSELPCTIWFTPQGLYRQLTAPLPEGQPDCCLDMPEIKASAPNWAVSTDPLPTFYGTDNDLYSGVLSDHWKYEATDPSTQKGCHEYRQVHGDTGLAGRPLLFTFPVSDGTQDYHFDPSSMVLGAPDASLMALPAGCNNADGTPFMCPQPAVARY